MEPDPTVELLLALRHKLWRETAYVVVGLATRQPRDGGVARSIDGTVDRLARLYVHDANDRFLCATLRNLVREQVAFL